VTAFANGVAGAPCGVLSSHEYRSHRLRQ